MPRRKARLTALEVLSAIHLARRITSVAATIGVEEINQVDKILFDLQEQLLKDYGDSNKDIELQERKHR